MPNQYKRKSTRQSWSEESMSAALEALQNGSCGYLKASKQFNVPKSTLERRFKAKNKYATGSLKILGGRKTTFPLQLERQLVEYVKNMETMLFGLTSRSIRSLAYQLAVKNKLKHYFNSGNEMAGWDWLRSFLKRNKLSLRLPEATSAARARGFNKEAVTAFFEILEPLQEKFNFPPSRIFNVDETGITTVQGRPSKVIATRGRKQVGTLTSAERGELTTAVICMSASGIFVPPMIIIPRVRMKPQFTEGSPPGTLTVVHKSGWMQLNLFDQWFDHFLLHTQASKNNPALLFLDGHKTHTQNISVINKARDRGVTIICLPPHCSHRIQPLDVSFMGPLSTFYTQEMEIWLRNHPGRCVTITEVPFLFGKAFLRAATPLNAINGFQKTGLYPVNRTVFTEDMFMPSAPTDMPQEENNATIEPCNSSEVISDCIDVSKELDGTKNTYIHCKLTETDDVNNIPSCSKSHIEATTHERDMLNKSEENCHSTLSNINVVSREVTPEKGIYTPPVLSDVPSSSSGVTYFSPELIAPYPKSQMKQINLKKGKRGRAEILTNTPYKKELENSLKKSKVDPKKVSSKTNIKSLKGKPQKK